MAQIPDGSRNVIHLDRPTQQGSEFITITKKSGVQWASCNKGIAEAKFPVANHDNVTHGHGPSPIMWLFLIPGAAIAIFGGIGIGSGAPIIAGATAIQALIAAAGLALVGLTGLARMKAIQNLMSSILAYLPAGSRVEFVQFETPCSETAGVDF